MSLKNIKYTSVDRVFSRLKGVIPLNNEDDIVEAIGDALEAIGAIQQYPEAVCFMKVDNYQCKIPKHFHSVLQIARNNSYMCGENRSCVNPTHIKNNIIKPITLDQHDDSIVILDLDLQTDEELGDLGYAPVFSLMYEYKNWVGSDFYRRHFSPVRLTTNSFFNSIVCKEAEYDKIYQNCGDEYDIIEGEVLRFSFKEGQVAIAYHRIRMGEDGLPMIPDDVSYINACFNYAIFKHFERAFYNGDEGAEKKMLTAETNWTWYCGQAGNKAMMLTGVDEHQNFLDQRTHILPKNARYFGNFGGLNKAERRRF